MTTSVMSERERRRAIRDTRRIVKMIRDGDAELVKYSLTRDGDRTILLMEVDTAVEGLNAIRG